MREKRSVSVTPETGRARWAFPDADWRDDEDLENLWIDSGGLSVLITTKRRRRYARIRWSSVVALEMVPDSLNLDRDVRELDRPASVYEIEHSRWLPSVMAVLPPGWPEPAHYMIRTSELSLDVAATEPPQVEWGMRTLGGISDLLEGGKA